LGHLRSNLRSRKIDFFGTVFFLAIPWWIETTGSEADHFARPAGWHRALADRAAWSPRCGSLAVDHPGLGQKAQLFRGKNICWVGHQMRGDFESSCL
jgi:hypothetical protein